MSNAGLKDAGMGLLGELPQILAPTNRESVKVWPLDSLFLTHTWHIEIILCHNFSLPVPTLALEVMELYGHCPVSKEPVSALCLFGCDWHAVMLWKRAWILPCYASLGATVSMVYKWSGDEKRWPTLLCLARWLNLQLPFFRNQTPHTPLFFLSF